MDSTILTAFGLAAPAGLNAYLPLLILALADRFSSTVTLDRPYDVLSSGWGIGIVTLLLTIEIVVDKIPGFDHANDLLQSVVRPAAGAVLAMAVTSDQAALNPVLAMILGLFVSGSVHAAKATTRPAVTVATGGLGNPLVSMAEDVIAAIAAISAIFLPFLVIVFIVLFAVFVLWAIRRMRRFRPSLAPSAASTNLRH